VLKSAQILEWVQFQHKFWTTWVWLKKLPFQLRVHSKSFTAFGMKRNPCEHEQND
jgi:hypothetical protein